MSPVEIIFVGLGIFLLLASCFVTGRRTGPEATLTQLPLELTEEQKKKLEEEIDHIFEERTDHLVIKADDYMSKISNEKIMAVNDFTAQIMEKIDYNHREVVFLYDMLNQKEAEIKETAQTLEEKRKSLKESVEDAIQLTKQLNAAKAEQLAFEEKTAAKGTPAGKASRKKASAEETSGKNTAYEADSTEARPLERTEKSSGKKAAAKTKAKTAKKEKAASWEEPEITQPSNRSEEILKLHRQGKSVLEISKALGLGQGEVKLVIDLYGSI